MSLRPRWLVDAFRAEQRVVARRGDGRALSTKPAGKRKSIRSDAWFQTKGPPGRFDPFAKPSGNGRNLRIPAVQTVRWSLRFTRGEFRCSVCVGGLPALHLDAA